MARFIYKDLDGGWSPDLLQNLDINNSPFQWIDDGWMIMTEGGPFR